MKVVSKVHWLNSIFKVTLSQNVPAKKKTDFPEFDKIKIWLHVSRTPEVEFTTCLQSCVSHKDLQSASHPRPSDSSVTGRGLQSGEGRDEMWRWVAKASITEERNYIKS